jgi:hypothetical protein
MRLERPVQIEARSKFRVLALLIAASITACSPGDRSAKEMPSKTTKATSIDGYGDLKFGMSFDEATALTGLTRFNPASVRGCLVELAIRGCLLHPENNLVAFTNVGGIAYTLTLAFNRLDKLTDVSLNYERDMTDDLDQKMSGGDCKALHERTADWLVDKFGPFENKKEKDTILVKTEKGSEYSSYTNGNTFIGSFQKTLKDKREVSLLSVYMVVEGNTNCDIKIQFSDVESVERWSLSPDEEREFRALSSQ